MLKALRLFGILLSAATIILAIIFFRDQDQVSMSWTMMGMCGALIFNGGATYFKTKDKMAALSSIVGIVLLIFSLTKFPFYKIPHQPIKVSGAFLRFISFSIKL